MLPGGVGVNYLLSCEPQKHDKVLRKRAPGFENVSTVFKPKIIPKIIKDETDLIIDNGQSIKICYQEVLEETISSHVNPRSMIKC